jgi:hypothetical protein
MNRKNHFAQLLLVGMFTALLFHGCNDKGGGTNNNPNVTRHIIHIDTARRYTAQFREGLGALKGALRDSTFLNRSFQLPLAVQFNRDILELLLKQTDKKNNIAAGVRMYFAINNKREVTLVLIPYDTSNNDILKNLTGTDVVSIPGISSASAFFLEYQAADNALRCPTICDNGQSGLFR